MESVAVAKWKKVYRLILRHMGAAALLLAMVLEAPNIGNGLRVLLERLVFSGQPISIAEGDAPAILSADPLPCAFDPPLTLSAGQVEEAVKEPTAAAPASGKYRIIDRSLAVKNPLTMCCMTDRLDPDPEKVLAAWEAARGKSGASVQTMAVRGEAESDAPLVLILHTHATEAFAPDGAAAIDETAPRSSDPTKNMVAVGDVVTEALLHRGISTVHCRELIDAPDFSAAYTREKAVIAEYLAKYPSIRYIFDIHRDAISSGDDLVRATTTVNGIPAAQIMFVVGTNEKGANHPDWQTNLGYALHLQTYLAGKYPGLMRVVNLRGASFNEQYTPHSLLVEIGTAAGSLSEAKAAAQLFAEAVAAEILS